MPPAGFEPTILASELSQAHILDRAATGIGEWLYANEETEYKKIISRNKIIEVNKLK
jgi:hypothetical protein